MSQSSREVTVKIISVYLPIILSVVFFDQAAKYFVFASGPVTSCNVGFAFGIFPFSNLFSAALTLAVLVLVGIFLARSKGKEQSFGLILIFGGGLSNLIDRFTRGCVVDFIDLKVWPAFNLADGAISVGVGVLAVAFLKDIKKKT